MQGERQQEARIIPRRQEIVWWIRPGFLLAGFLVPLYLLLAVLPLSAAVNTYYYTPPLVLLGLGFLLVVAAFAYAFSRNASLGSGSGVRMRVVYLDVLAGITVCAYVIWFYAVLSNPRLFLDLLLGATASVGGLRDEATKVPGVTSFAQLGVIYVAVYANCRWIWNIALRRRHHLYLGLILALALFRTIAWSERLSFIEVLLPLIVVVASRPSKSKLTMFLLQGGPYIASSALLVFFGAFEYFRSWSTYYYKIYDSFFQFIAERFSMYYYTALNNGMGLLTEYPWPTFQFQHVLAWLYKAPLFGNYFSVAMGLNSRSNDLLISFCDPEFNNMSGIFTVFYDMGVVGGLVFAAVFGGFSGYFYTRFASRDRFSYVYPAIFVSLLEIFRFIYFGESRAFPIMLFLIVSAFFVRKSRVQG